ncbi:MAG: hypothetical protein BGO39_32545 [Chloroflexi bacterium 54-19]|nr:MAG: hypothetical protein BGO39_32545 [Chloroflexi bacterium 54-19]
MYPAVFRRLRLKLLLPALAGMAILLPALALVARAADPDFGGVTAFQNRWLEQDHLVGTPGVNRPYTWGPNVPGAPTTLTESYADSPGGTRRVLYLDKARMEINNPNNGFVTTGLAVKELVSGMRQDGDNVFTPLSPSQTQVAGDPVASNPNTPVYASFKNLVTLGNADGNSKPNAVGQLINQAVSKDGSVSTITPPENITIGAYQSQTGHNIAAPFENFKNQVGPVTNPGNGATVNNQPIYTVDPTSNVFGLAISEPYWAATKIAGVDRLVLVQLFERRVLTYNPALPNNKVEMGNLGQHYYQWRYVESGTGPGTVSGFQGTWKTNIAIVTLNVNGNNVTGSFKEYADTNTYALKGTLSGNVLSGYYNNNPANVFKFQLTNGGQGFTGTWNNTEQWCGVRSGPLPAGCGWSGTWGTNFSTLTLTQDADKVSGSYRDYNASLDVPVNANVNGIYGRPFLDGTYGPLASNTLHLEMYGNGSSFGGSYRTAYQWCGVRSGSALPEGCGWSGKWNVNFQGLTKTIHLTQTGGSVTGTQDGSSGTTIFGTLSDRYYLKGSYFNLVFQWYMVSSGNTQQQFDGKYILTGTNQGMCGWRDDAVQPSPCYRA